MTDTATVGDRVVALRHGRGWSQQKLATEAGLHTATVQKIEYGRHGPHGPAATTVTALARALGVSLDELLTGSQPVTPQ